MDQGLGLYVAASVLDDILRAKNILHEASLVHGDIRRPNILVLENVERQAPGGTRTGGVGAQRAMLLDFDWAGPVGRVSYPHYLNDAIKWPESARRGGHILKEHDNFMYDLLTWELSALE